MWISIGQVNKKKLSKQGREKNGTNSEDSPLVITQSRTVVLGSIMEYFTFKKDA